MENTVKEYMWSTAYDLGCCVSGIYDYKQWNVLSLFGSKSRSQFLGLNSSDSVSFGLKSSPLSSTISAALETALTFCSMAFKVNSFY